MKRITRHVFPDLELTSIEIPNAALALGSRPMRCDWLRDGGLDVTSEEPSPRPWWGEAWSELMARGQ